MRHIIVAALLTASLAPARARAQERPPPPPGGEDGATALVREWYRRYLGRSADQAPDAPYWVQQLRAGNPPAGLLTRILGTPEYYNRTGGNDRAFIGRLLFDVSGRPASPREVEYWLGRLYHDASRDDLASEVLARYPEAVGGGGPPHEEEYHYRRPYHDHRPDYDRRDGRRPDYDRRER